MWRRRTPSFFHSSVACSARCLACCVRTSSSPAVRATWSWASSSGSSRFSTGMSSTSRPIAVAISIAGWDWLLALCSTRASGDSMSGMEGESAANEQPIRITADMLEVPRPVDVRVDFEQGMGYAPPATLVLILALGAIFGWQLSVGALASEESIIAAGALVRERIAQGEWWRLLSATVLHGNVEHIVGNAMYLYILGMATEHAYGTRAMLTISRAR